MYQSPNNNLELLVSVNSGEEYQYSEKEEQVIGGTFSLFRISQQDRDRQFEYLDGRDIITYINDSVRRFVTNVDAREDIEDWQARVNDPFTRNKVQAILGKIVDALPIANFIPRGDEDPLKA